MESKQPNQEAAFEELDRVAPDAPFLALGQTVFWDEPMKAGVALESAARGRRRRFVAGVHDADYFAKLPHFSNLVGYRAFPHNDTTTRGLWSAAGEFSALFGSEAVVSRDLLKEAGLRLTRVAADRPGLLDEATEAWGWRGLVALGHEPDVVAETPLDPLLPELSKTLEWAIDESIRCIVGTQEQTARVFGRELISALLQVAEADRGQTLSDCYRSLLPWLYRFVANEPVEIETTSTTELLRFNTATCRQPRFEYLDAFLGERRAEACAAYDETVRGGEIYPLERFGSWAIPFDLVVPGRGRGTLRIAPRAIIVMTPEPIFVTTKRPVRSVQDLAEAIERKLGDRCTLVGKAVTLIGLLAREFVFVFHEGASAYVRLSRQLHQRLKSIGVPVRVHPILRVRYDAWDALDACCTWLRLPEPLRQPFGAEEMCGRSFAARWRGVVSEQADLLQQLAQLRRPLDLIRFLAKSGVGRWDDLANEYEALHDELMALHDGIGAIKARKAEVARQIRAAKQARIDAEVRKGRHWRERIFEKSPGPEDLEERARLETEVNSAIRAVQDGRRAWHELQLEQDALVSRESIQRAHERRRSLELEAELRRLKLARQAIIVTRGLELATRRPSAWWFPLVCSQGNWFHETVRRAEYYLEPLD